MLAIQADIKYMEKNNGRYFLLGVIAFVMVVISATAYSIYNTESNNTSVVDTIELTCDMSINENNEINTYQLTVAGYLETGNINSEKVPLMISQSFDLITGGAITNIENITLLVYIDGDSEAFKYDTIYAVLEKIDIGRLNK